MPQAPLLFHEKNKASKTYTRPPISFQHEDDLGVSHVAGVDEVGYGAWAGPIVVAAAWLNRACIPDYFLAKLDDSKRLGAKKRQEIHDLFLKNPLWGRYAIAAVEIPDIIQGKVLKHTLQAMVRALSDLSAAVSHQVQSEGVFSISDKRSSSLVGGSNRVEEGGIDHFIGTIFGGVIVDGRHRLPAAKPMALNPSGNMSDSQQTMRTQMKTGLNQAAWLFMNSDAGKGLPIKSNLKPNPDCTLEGASQLPKRTAYTRGLTRGGDIPREESREAAIGVPIEWVQKPIPGADSQSYTVALASIMAKVTRDTLMETLAQEYPDFGWEKNKGYGTQEHQNAIRHAMHNKNQQGGQHHGLSPHHRPFYCKRACL